MTGTRLVPVRRRALPTPEADPARRFRLVRAAVTISSLGDGTRFVALPLLATSLTADPRQVAAVSLAEQLPWLLLGLTAGALADRLDRRRLLWAVDAARAVVVGALAMVVATGAATVPLLVVAGFLLGCGQILYNGAWSGMVPALVEPSGLSRANARLQATGQIGDTLLGTPLGAVLFGIGATLPFVVDAGSFAVAAALVALIAGDFRPRKAAPTEGLPRKLRHDVAEGIRWLWRHRRLRRLCLVTGAANAVGTGLVAILVLYAGRLLGLDGLGFALLVASYAVGGVLGATVTPRLTSRFGPARVLRPATPAAALTVVGAGSATSGAVAGLCVAGYGAASLVWSVAMVTLRQTLLPTELLGRVTMAYQMAAGGSGALGAVAAGFTAHLAGVRAPFFIGAALLLAATAVLTGSTPPPRAP